VSENNPIVDEVRKAGEAYFAEFKFDLRAICADLQRRSAERGVQPVSFPPRPAEPRNSPHVKKAS
jgi:hypothetical protein